MRPQKSNTTTLYSYNFEKVNKLDSSYSERALRPSLRSRKLAVNVKDGMVFILPQDITKVESYGNQAILTLANGTTHVVNKSLKDFEDILGDVSFMRVHKCYLINLNFVSNYNKEMNYVEMEDGSRADISRRKKEDFFKSFMYV